ncbi:amino acid/polyamine/organocation transporter, APC superfamily (TC 2.A.3) [Caloramator fervidus]|uniref:Amino acid/polyamine/organocation transporter, APC superfamily (TC 2.A.3) n=1 Tax=Caloramator fervidus TaxID=29344 RepID=A0A1H5TE07_9CLOT|nr:amino acid permease [Caloramator fervidus]SEF61003.1 amino acid/polyamine/organocation transporter, APC superfamily (TC 2.A.3) [Caloramator fervidus]
MENNTNLKRELGLAAATAIVVGNMIGSGIFMAPQGLAAASNPKATIIAWIITALGSMLLALSFANMGAKMPKTGGPIVYTKAAFGQFAAFLIAWTYWIGSWVGNAAIITAFMSYLTYFFPIFGENRALAFIVSSLILWIFTYINYKGVKEAGIIGIITTVLKIVPLIIFSIIALMHFNPSYFNTASSPEVNSLSTVPAAIAITLWSFVGLECATIPAGEIKNPERNIKLSTIYGTLITALVYILISILAIGAMPQGKLATSNAPLADIINYATGGKWGGTLIALGAAISTLGATSGWILVTARSSFAAAEEKMFPKVFAKVHPKYQTPSASLIISGIATNILLIMNYVSSLTSAFNFMLLLATLSFLPAYSFTAAAEILLLKNKSENFNLFRFIKNSFISLLAFAYSIYAIYGTGAEVVMYGFILMLIGIPFYVYQRIQNKTNYDISSQI